MKNWKTGAVSGGIAGLVGAWLVSEYDFSLLVVILIGAVIGVVVGIIPELLKKLKKKK